MPGYKIYDQKAMHFLTFQVVNWIDVFSRQAYRDIFLDSMRYCRENFELKVHAYVIMSNHVHLIVAARGGRDDLSTVIGKLKRFTSNRILETIADNTESRRKWMLNMFEEAASKHARNKKYQLWTHDNHPIELDDEVKFVQRFDYLHDNPVRAGWVLKPEDYLYSSARNYARIFAMAEIDLIDDLIPDIRKY